MPVDRNIARQIEDMLDVRKLDPAKSILYTDDFLLQFMALLVQIAHLTRTKAGQSIPDIPTMADTTAYLSASADLHLRTASRMRLASAENSGTQTTQPFKYTQWRDCVLGISEVITAFCSLPEVTSDFFALRDEADIPHYIRLFFALCRIQMLPNQPASTTSSVPLHRDPMIGHRPVDPMLPNWMKKRPVQAFLSGGLVVWSWVEVLWDSATDKSFDDKATGYVDLSAFSMPRGDSVVTTPAATAPAPVAGPSGLGSDTVLGGARPVVGIDTRIPRKKGKPYRVVTLNVNGDIVYEQLKEKDRTGDRHLATFDQLWDFIAPRLLMGDTNTTSYPNCAGCDVLLLQELYDYMPVIDGLKANKKLGIPGTGPLNGGVPYSAILREHWRIDDNYSSEEEKSLWKEPIYTASIAADGTPMYRKSFPPTYVDSPVNTYRGWLVEKYTWTARHPDTNATHDYIIILLITRTENRNIAVIFDAEMGHDVPEIITTTVKASKNRPDDALPFDDFENNLKPPLGVRLWWTVDAEGKPIRDEDRDIITFYSFHAHDAGSNRDWILHLINTHTTSPRWAVLGDFNKEPDDRGLTDDLCPYWPTRNWQPTRLDPNKDYSTRETEGKRIGQWKDDSLYDYMVTDSNPGSPPPDPPYGRVIGGISWQRNDDGYIIVPTMTDGHGNRVKADRRTNPPIGISDHSPVWYNLPARGGKKSSS